MVAPNATPVVISIVVRIHSLQLLELLSSVPFQAHWKKDVIQLVRVP
jgi:hypothetical protein